HVVWLSSSHKALWRAAFPLTISKRFEGKRTRAAKYCQAPPLAKFRDLPSSHRLVILDQRFSGKRAFTEVNAARSALMYAPQGLTGTITLLRQNLKSL